MEKHKKLTPLDDDLIFCYMGMETELVFKRGLTLPGFAAYPLLADVNSRLILREYYEQLLALAKKYAVTVVLDSVTWVANRDRGAALGYSPATLRQSNIDAIALMADVRASSGDSSSLLCGHLGPRGDGYSAIDLMTPSEAAEYHSEQMDAYHGTDVDFVGAFTLTNAEEAAGIVLAAKAYGLPVSISFTLETDGCLPSGMSLSDAIEFVDALTDSYALHYLVNCAHPEHVKPALSGPPESAIETRLKGVVANASSASHAELDEAEFLDEGNPLELAHQMAQLHRDNPQLKILGGCCGTNLHHMQHIIEQVLDSKKIDFRRRP